MSDSVRKKYISDDNKDPYHFKALPLPGGKTVKSDIFAMTKAVTGKKSKKLNNICEPELDAGKKIAYQRESKRRVPYERFTSKELSMLQYFNSSNHIESDVSLNESSSLRRDITRLELLLRRAKEIYTHKIKRLDDYNAISLDKTFLKYIDLDDEVGSICSTFSDASNSTYHSQVSLYERQQRWLVARRRKQVLARQKYEEDALVRRYSNNIYELSIVSYILMNTGWYHRQARTGRNKIILDKSKRRTCAKCCTFHGRRAT